MVLTQGIKASSRAPGIPVGSSLSPSWCGQVQHLFPTPICALYLDSTPTSLLEPQSALYKWPVFDQDCCVELLVGACMHSHITSCPQSSCLSKYMYPPQTNYFLSILYQFWEHWKYRVKWIASFIEGGINLVYNQAFSPAFPWWEFTVPRVLKLNY